MATTVVINQTAFCVLLFISISPIPSKLIHIAYSKNTPTSHDSSIMLILRVF